MSRAAAKAKAAKEPAHVAPRELMPPELAAAGWELLEHQGENADEYQCVNRARNLDTRLSHKPQVVIDAARKIQERGGAAPEGGDTAPSPRASFARTLTRRLTSEEINARLDRLKEIDDRITKLTAERDEIVKQYKEDIAGVEGERRHVLDELKLRAVETEVDCREVFDFDRGVAVCYRNDTDEEVDRRPLTPQEMHRPLPFA